MKAVRIRPRWRELDADPEAARRIAAELGVSPLVAQVLAGRGFNTPEKAATFLEAPISNLHDPLLLPDMERACERLRAALANRERILVHGDYDGDGVTSAALVTRLLRALGAEVDAFVPERKHGYDLKDQGLARARAFGAKLIVTTDCGVTRMDEIEAARDAGIDVIVTDHHELHSSGTIPAAVAVINPKRADSRYPFRELAGVGVAFKLGQALTTHLGGNTSRFERAYLDLAAVGTVTDIMPLTGENRILVKHGLAQLAQTRKPGLKALIAAAELTGKPISSSDVGFRIGPMLNAAGRVAESADALDTLLTTDESEAARLAGVLKGRNTERKERQRRVERDAVAMLADVDTDAARCIVLAGEWPPGVIGIAANKIVERFHRPAVLIALEDGRVGRGSARSIAGFDMKAAMDGCDGLLIEHGGHAHAAGMSIAVANIDEFRTQMDAAARRALTAEQLLPDLHIAGRAEAGDVTLDLAESMAKLEPFGRGNEQPVVALAGGCISDVRTMGQDGSHLRFRYTGSGRSVVCKWWGRGEEATTLREGASASVAGTLDVNQFNGNVSAELVVSDVR